MNWEELAAHELENGERALKEGNDGRARACSRRAVGTAIAAYSLTFPSKALPGSTAVDRLRALAASEYFPESIRKAALRLTTNVNDRLSVDFTLHPIRDARIVIDYFSNRIKEKAS